MTGQQVRQTPLDMYKRMRVISNSGNNKLTGLDKFILVQGHYPFNLTQNERQTFRAMMKQNILPI